MFVRCFGYLKKLKLENKNVFNNYTLLLMLRVETSVIHLN